LQAAPRSAPADPRRRPARDRHPGASRAGSGPARRRRLAGRVATRPAMSVVTSPFGALAVIVDPRAGEGSVAAEVGSVRRALERGGLEHRVQIAVAPGDVARLAAAALDEGYRYVAAVGDDATVQDVV